MFKETKVYKWLDNFWYHHKWYLIIVGFFVIFAIIATTQLVTKKDADINMIYTGPHVFAVEEIHSVESAFEQVMTLDANGDGVKNASMLDLTLLTEEQIKFTMEEAEKMGYEATFNAQELQATEKNFNTQMFSGEAVICMLDPHWYEQVKESGGFMKLNDALGYVPESAIDEYGIRLHDTDFAKFFTAFKKFPEDTVLCIRTVTTMSIFKGVEKEEMRHSYHVQAFKDAVGFKLPEGWTPETEVATEE